jgi:hypothetical protein
MVDYGHPGGMFLPSRITQTSGAGFKHPARLVADAAKLSEYLPLSTRQLKNLNFIGFLTVFDGR